MHTTRRASEDGYILVAVMFMLALLIIAMAVAAPKIARSIQRDRELETMHRGKQYARAVKLYYKKFNAYPPNIDALVKTNEIRFLRKKYLDPMTGKADWKPIALGQNKAPTMMGFFGQPIGGAGMGGGLCGNALPNSSGSSSSPSGSTSSSGTSSGFGPSSSSFGGSSGSSFGSSPTAGCPPSGSTTGTDTTSGATTGTASGTDPNAASGTDPNAANGSSSSNSGGANNSSAFGSSTTGSSSTGQNGQTFGGPGIMGFEPASPKPSILVYKKKTHYNEWEFVYDPLAEQLLMQGGLNQGSNGLMPTTPGSPSTPGLSPTTPTTAPTQTPTTPSPQQ
jgi:type II secretory pathway pseudopilin PulG